MVFKWGHPVATLPSNKGKCKSLSQNDETEAMFSQRCMTTATSTDESYHSNKMRCSCVPQSTVA
eukprot:5410303-Pleurochrysis_carterae.AAC.1